MQAYASVSVIGISLMHLNLSYEPEQAPNRKEVRDGGFRIRCFFYSVPESWQFGQSILANSETDLKLVQIDFQTCWKFKPNTEKTEKPEVSI